MITVFINGAALPTEAGLQLTQLFPKISQSLDTRQPLAVEINGRLIPQKEWPSTQILDNDRIEIIRLVGGG